MRELDPKSPHILPACTVVGAGRLGTVLAAALSDGPALRRGEPIPATAEVVLLTVPDGKIAEAARAVPDGPLVGHCSRRDRPGGVRRREGFSLHPLMSVPTGSTAERPARRGRGGRRHLRARAGRGERRSRQQLGMIATHVAAEDRAAYHAAGAIASNFLVALEACAERLAATTGITPPPARPARPGHRATSGPSWAPRRR